MTGRASGLSPALLVEDLGRPARFANMLRVLKPTSPMNTGAWLLAAMGPAVVGAAASELTGAARGPGRGLELVSGALGPLLATYAAVLLADTAVPAWHEAARELPFVFASGAAASAGAAAALLTTGPEAAPARRLAVGGALAGLAATRLMQRRLGPELGAPYSAGRPGRLSRWARLLTGLGAGLLAGGGRRRALEVAGAAAVLAGAAVERFAVVEAGVESALDPTATVAPQRRRLDPAQAQPEASAMRSSPV